MIVTVIHLIVYTHTQTQTGHNTYFNVMIINKVHWKIQLFDFLVLQSKHFQYINNIYSSKCTEATEILYNVLYRIIPSNRVDGSTIAVEGSEGCKLHIYPSN